MSIEGDEVKSTSIRLGIRRAQDLYRQYAIIDMSVDDFLRERRAETMSDTGSAATGRDGPQAWPGQ